MVSPRPFVPVPNPDLPENGEKQRDELAMLEAHDADIPTEDQTLEVDLFLPSVIADLGSMSEPQTEDSLSW